MHLPKVALCSRGFRSPRDKSQVPAPRKVMDVLDANACQAGNFRVREDFLARFDLDHGTLADSAPLFLAPHLI